MNTIGRIMKIETLRLLNEMDSSECYWKEEPQKDKSCIFFLRVYFVNRADLKPEKAPEIGTSMTHFQSIFIFYNFYSDLYYAI